MNIFGATTVLLRSKRTSNTRVKGQMHAVFCCIRLRLDARWSKRICMSLVIVRFFCYYVKGFKDNIRYDNDVFSRSKQVLILPYRLSIAAVTAQPNQDGTRHSVYFSSTDTYREKY